MGLGTVSTIIMYLCHLLCIEYRILLFSDASYWKSNVRNLIWLRNHIVVSVMLLNI